MHDCHITSQRDIKQTKARYFSLLKNAQTGSGAQSASYSQGMGLFLSGKSDLGIKLSSHSHLVPSLRMSGTITSLSVEPYLQNT